MFNYVALYSFVCVREKKELKAKQAKHSMESVKSVMADKSVKNKAERDRSVPYSNECFSVISDIDTGLLLLLFCLACTTESRAIPLLSVSLCIHCCWSPVFSAMSYFACRLVSLSSATACSIELHSLILSTTIMWSLPAIWVLVFVHNHVLKNFWYGVIWYPFFKWYTFAETAFPFVEPGVLAY